MKLFYFSFMTILVNGLTNSVLSIEGQDYENWDRAIFREGGAWDPVITSGPTILVSSNTTTIYDRNGDPVTVQLSNNNVGIGNNVDHYF